MTAGRGGLEPSPVPAPLKHRPANISDLLGEPWLEHVRLYSGVAGQETLFRIGRIPMSPYNIPKYLYREGNSAGPGGTRRQAEGMAAWSKAMDL